jgi:rubrerythrin
MAEPVRQPPQVTLVVSALRAPISTPDDDAKTLCERCGAEMYRMHAVWRCPQCRFKTDCCGW